MNQEHSSSAWRGVILLTCLAALYVAWRTINRYEAAACDAVSAR